MVVALRTVSGQTEKRFTNMLDGGIHPRRAVENKPVAGEESCGSQSVEIVRIEFVGSEHRPNHLVIAKISVERFHNPVAEMPHVMLAIAKLFPQSPPVGISPNIHPVTCPPLAVSRIFQEPVHQSLVPIRRGVGHQGDKLI